MQIDEIDDGLDDSDIDDDRPADVVSLSYGEHLLIWTIRQIIVRRDIGTLVRREYAQSCGDDAVEVLMTFQMFLAVLGCSARRRISIGHPGCLCLTLDEREILSAVSAAQKEGLFSPDLMLSGIARNDAREQLAIAVRALASAFATHGLWLRAGRSMTPQRQEGASRLLH